MVGESSHVGRRVEQGPSLVSVRSAEAGTVEGDQPHAPRLGDGGVGTQQSPAGRAMEEKHRHAGRIAPFCVREYATVAQVKRALAARAGSAQRYSSTSSMSVPKAVLG